MKYWGIYTTRRKEFFNLILQCMNIVQNDIWFSWPPLKLQLLQVSKICSLWNDLENLQLMVMLLRFPRVVLNFVLEPHQGSIQQPRSTYLSVSKGRSGNVIAPHNGFLQNNQWYRISKQCFLYCKWPISGYASLKVFTSQNSKHFMHEIKCSSQNMFKWKVLCIQMHTFNEQSDELNWTKENVAEVSWFSLLVLDI